MMYKNSMYKMQIWSVLQYFNQLCGLHQVMVAWNRFMLPDEDHRVGRNIVKS